MTGSLRSLPCSAEFGVDRLPGHRAGHIKFELPSGATATNCVRSGSTYVDPLFHRTLTIKLGDQAAVPSCSPAGPTEPSAT